MYDLTIADVATYIRQRYVDAVGYMHFLQRLGINPDSKLYCLAKQRVDIFEGVLTALDIWG